MKKRSGKRERESSESNQGHGKFLSVSVSDQDSFHLFQDQTYGMRKALPYLKIPIPGHPDRVLNES